MKLVVREIVKVLPGKWSEAIELHKKRVEIATKMGSSPFRAYRSESGQGDWAHTIIIEREWESFAKWESFFERALKDPIINKEFL